MKLTKGKLNKIIKEEIERVVMKEASDYVMDAFDIINEKLGPETFLQELIQSMSDSEAIESFKFIARNHDIDLTQKTPPSEETSQMGQDADQQIQESVSSEVKDIYNEIIKQDWGYNIYTFFKRQGKKVEPFLFNFIESILEDMESGFSVEETKKHYLSGNWVSNWEDNEQNISGQIENLIDFIYNSKEGKE